MKRTAVILGIAAAMVVVPSVASADSDDAAEAAVQASGRRADPEAAAGVDGAPHRGSASLHRFSPQRISLIHISSR